jgi:phosphohistidine phosphatase
MSSILLVRHGKAEEEHVIGDWARGLTDAGREAFRVQAGSLARRVRLRGVVSSPLVRAIQTAEILAAACGLASVYVRSELLPGPKSAGRHLALFGELQDGYAFVGHNPGLTKAAELAVGVKQLDIALKKGAALALRRDDNGWALDWLKAPGRQVETLSAGRQQARPKAPPKARRA